ncbi:MAG: hypothetical protein DRQ57_04450 [Gammaproteobacteria bacterium]|nr:MAG: hypothetical protein DRQ57_04450 [Gammaproteobacteria bacterium]
MNKIKNIITQAFDNVPYPKNITLYVAQAHDNYEYDEDKKYKKSDFVGRWQDIPSSHIEDCCCALSHLDPEGIRFYLPAFMLWTLDNYESKTEEISYATFSAFIIYKNKNLESFHKEQFSLFSKEQKYACAMFLKYFIDNYKEEIDYNAEVKVAKQAFEQKWHKYLII